MKCKKFLALLTAVLFTVGLLAGCKADPAKKYLTLTEELGKGGESQIIEGDFTLKVNGMGLLAMRLKATNSVKTGQTYLELGMKSSVDSTPLLTAVSDDSHLYLNMSRLLSLMEAYDEELPKELTALKAAGYIRIPNNTPENDANENAQGSGFTEQLEKLILDAEQPLVTENDGVYTLTLTNEHFQSAVQSIVDYGQEHLDELMALLTTYLETNAANDPEMKNLLELMKNNPEEVKKNLRETMAQLPALMAQFDVQLTNSISKEKNAYLSDTEFTLKASDGSSLGLTVHFTNTREEPQSVEIPTEYVDLQDLNLQLAQ